MPITLAWVARVSPKEPLDDWRVEFPDGRVLKLRLPLRGDFLPSRLEAAVHAALGVTPAPPPSPLRWRLECTQSTGGGPFELEERTHWTVWDQRTNNPLCRFTYEESRSYTGSGWSDCTGASGTDEVVLSADGLHVLARDSGEVKCHRLPDEPTPAP